MEFSCLIRDHFFSTDVGYCWLTFGGSSHMTGISTGRSIPGHMTRSVSVLGDSVLQDTTSHTYLGVEIQQDLKWNSHINNITAQARKTLGFVRCNLGFCSKETKVAAYVSLVRPTLEYCSAIWDPYTQELTQKVGKTQRRAAQLVHKNYDWQTSVSGLIQDLGWDMLSTRHKIARLNILHKAIGGHLALPVQNYLHLAQRQTRRSRSSAFIEHQTRIDAYKYSFVPRTVRDWNNILQSITETSQFKSAVNFIQAQEANIMD